MIVACNILEQLPDPDKALMEINNLARKQVLITVCRTNPHREGLAQPDRAADDHQ